MAHNYIVTAQKPTAVTACVTGIKTIEFDLKLFMYITKVTKL